jgi:hypothetical protein
MAAVASGYLPVAMTGLQMLCVTAVGYVVGRQRLMEPAIACRVLNRFVVLVCLPALQFWLLAIKTDMRNMQV